MQPKTRTNRSRPVPAHSSPTAPFTLKPHATILPLESTSAVPERGLAVLQWTLFDGLTQLQAMERYNAAGYSTKPITTNDGISHIFRSHGKTWYAEQGFMRPWALRSQEERKELYRAGYTKEDFRFVHPRNLPVENEGGDRDIESVEGGRYVSSLQGEAVRREGRRARVRTSTVRASTLASSGIIVEDTDHYVPSPRSSTPRAIERSCKSLILTLAIPTAFHPGRPLPLTLKIALLAKHIEWLEANVVAYETGSAARADEIEVELDALEREARRLNRPEFRSFKMGREGYGIYSSSDKTLVSFGGLEVLRARLEGMRREEEGQEEEGRVKVRWRVWRV